MAVDMFIKIPGADGESDDDAHADEIRVSSFSWGASQQGSANVGRGGGAGKVNMQDFSFTHNVDKASPNLFLFCCNGKHLDEVVFIARKAGEDPLEYLKFTFTDVLVSSVQQGGSEAGDLPVETVSLNFAKVEVGYTPQKPDGTGDTEITAGFDLAKNVKV